MLTYPKSTDNFPPLISPNRTYGAGRTHVGLCPKFLVYIYGLNVQYVCLLYTSDAADE